MYAWLFVQMNVYTHVRSLNKCRGKLGDEVYLLYRWVCLMKHEYTGWFVQCIV